MALPTSGPLSMNAIAQELLLQHDFTTPYSLRTLSNYAGFSTPDAMSEFYGYGAAPAATLSYAFNQSSEAGGSMEVYKNKVLVINPSSTTNGTISASSGESFDVNVYAYSYAVFTANARIMYPNTFAGSLVANVTAGGYAAASYTFTWDGTNATITGYSSQY